MRKRTELLIDFDKNDFRAGHAKRSGKSRSANASSKVSNALSREHRTRRGQQDGIMADTVSGPWLPQSQAPGQDGIFGNAVASKHGRC